MDLTATQRAAIYVRVSTEEQALEGQSVDAQIETLVKYCKLYGIDIYDIYKDLGVSGKSLRNRSGLQLMLKDASKGKFNIVLVWKISRLSRSLKDLLLILEQLEQCNIVFSSYSEKFDTSSPVGRMTLQLLGSIAEFERNTIIDNVKLGLKEYARKGGKTGTILGYDSINKQLKINLQEAEIVKLIYKLYVINRMSMADIAEFLNSQGYTTKRGKRFRKDGISVILSNPTYIGRNRHNVGTREEYQTAGSHQPIVDMEIWEAAQELRKSNKNYRPARGVKTSFILTNKLICRECGSPMKGFYTKAASKAYTYYKCKTCGSLVSAEKIEKAVLEAVFKMLQNRRIINDTLNKINASFIQGKSAEQLQQIQNQIKSLRGQLEKYIDLYSIEELSNSKVLIEKIKSTENKLNELQVNKARLEAEIEGAFIALTEEDYENIIKQIFFEADARAIKNILDSSIREINIDKSSCKGLITFTFCNDSSKYLAFVF